MVLVELGALAVGVYLAAMTSWVVLGIGLAGMVAAVLYTAGPFPLGYHGLGDIFVFLFFGLAAVAGTHFVLTQEWDQAAFWLGVPMGTLGAAVLTVNNIRDLDTDAQVGKRTIPVRLGRPLARLYYGLLLLVPYAVVGWMVTSGDLPNEALFSFLTIPLGLHLFAVVRTKTDGESLNAALGKTAGLLFAFGALLSAGLFGS